MRSATARRKQEAISTLRAALPVLVPAIREAVVREMMESTKGWIIIKDDERGELMDTWLVEYLPAAEERESEGCDDPPPTPLGPLLRGGWLRDGVSPCGVRCRVGVDIAPQPRYPFTFVQADALDYLAAHAHEFDAIHASPPCQAYSMAAQTQRNQGKVHPDLVAPTRKALAATDKPWVIENAWCTGPGGLPHLGLPGRPTPPSRPNFSEASWQTDRPHAAASPPTERAR